jgi:dTMP kinase
MDLGLSDDPKESFRLFQSKILEEYDKIAVEYGLTVIDATLPIQKQQAILRDIIKEKLKDYEPTPFLKKKENVYVA